MPKMQEPLNKSPRRSWCFARRCVQILALLLFMMPLLFSGWDLFGLTLGGADPIATPAEAPFFGTLSSSQMTGINLLDPFGVLQLIAASKTIAVDWLIFALPVVFFYAILRGRIFCGWVCPVNFLLEGLDWIRKKLGIAVAERPVPRHTKIVIALAVLAASLITSVPIFETFSPISAINKGLVIGSVAGLWVLLSIVLIELFWGHRVWCRALCPLGGFYEAIGRVGTLDVHFNSDACIHCDKCKQACLADPLILDPVLLEQDSIVRAGDCMLCGACIDACPTKALCVLPSLEHFQPKKSN